MAKKDPGKPKMIFTTWDRAEAEIIKGIIEGQGITCMLSSHITHLVYPFSMDGLGEIRIYVSEERAEEALELIRAFSEQRSERESEQENEQEEDQEEQQHE